MDLIHQWMAQPLQRGDIVLIVGLWVMARAVWMSRRSET